MGGKRNDQLLYAESLLSGSDLAVKSDKGCDDAMRAGRWEEVIQTRADPFDTKFCHA